MTNKIVGEKEALETSKRLCAVIAETDGIDNSKKIAERNKTILALEHQKMESVWLNEKPEIRRLSGLLDIERSRVAALKAERPRKRGEALEAYEKFMRPYRREIEQKIRKRYAEIDRLKAYRQDGPTKFNILGQPLYTIKTNIIPLLSEQLRLSAGNAELRHTVAPLAQLRKMVDEILSLTPDSFPEEEAKLTDTEMVQLRQVEFFPTQAQLAAGEWEPEIMAERSIQFNIDGLKSLMKPRQPIAKPQEEIVLGIKTARDGSELSVAR